MQKAFEGSVCFYILTSLAILFLDLPGACVLSRMDVLAHFTLLDNVSSLLFFSERMSCQFDTAAYVALLFNDF
jgi:hypothetical protein